MNTRQSAIGKQDHPLFHKLARGCVKLGLDVPNEQLNLMLTYLELLHRWNDTHNLTAIKTVDEMVTHHLLDSLSIASYVKGQALLDVGTGAGLPGLPLAIIKPDLSVTLLDSRGKKTSFLTEIKRSLGLSNVEIVKRRVEDYLRDPGFDTITCRAFSSLKDFASATQHLLTSNGQLLAMKGVYPEQEIRELEEEKNWQKRISELGVPGVDAPRCVVVLSIANAL